MLSHFFWQEVMTAQTTDALCHWIFLYHLLSPTVPTILTSAPQ